MPSSLIFCSASMMRRVFFGSSDATGSSASRICGFCISARQMATRCIWPPERCSARCSACGSMLSHCNSSIARARSASSNSLKKDFRVEVWLRRPSSTLVITSKRGTRQKSWKIMPQRARHWRIWRPASWAISCATPSSSKCSISPQLEGMVPLRVCSSVDLPAPERPITATNSPACRSKLMSSSTRCCAL